MKVRIRLTPAGHYFLGGERGFGYDKQLRRQMVDSYFISSLKVPTQTTLFGALRYIIGVADEKLKTNAGDLIGNQTYDLTDNNDSFGIINSISPVYLYKDEADDKGNEGYYIRTPLDHKTIAHSIENGQEKNTDNVVYTPFRIASGKTVEVIHFPGESHINKQYPLDYIAKDGIASSYLSVSDKKIVKEEDIFISSVEVVSKKAGGNSPDDGFAKKEYMRLNKGWSFVFFAELDTENLPDYNRSVVLGKDSSVFAVDISEDEEPDVSWLFEDREGSFHYCQSPIYITDKLSDIIDKCSFCVIENESLRRFKTKGSKLQPEYNASLLQLISAGSILYSDDISMLMNAHAAIAGFNTIINGGKKK